MARVLLLAQTGFNGLLTVILLAWTVVEEPHDPPTPIGRDFTLAEAAGVAAFLAYTGVTLAAWWRLRRGRPRLALVLAGLTLLVVGPSLLSSPELGWWVAMQVGILVSAWRSRHASGAVPTAAP